MRFTGRALLIAGLSLAALVLLALVVLPRLNPFAEETIDRSQPAVLKSIEDLGELKSATANLQVIVDLEKDAKYVPGWLKGERTLFIAAGTVDAVIDLRKVRKGDIKVSDDRRTATLTLPAAALRKARLDPERSRVYDRDRGVVDRVGDAFGDGDGDPEELYATGARKLEEAAAADPDLLKRAQENATTTLSGLLKGLGFTRVVIRFKEPASAPR